MTPLDYYHERCQQGLYFADEQQITVLQHLQMIHQQLIDEYKHRPGLLRWVRKKKLIQGLYVWGGVGIGKTFLMDCFYHCIPFPKKMRMHFHQFMQYIHQELKLHQGEKNPLQIIAKKIAHQTILLCFDELFVNDIADAMILARLFQALFAQGVCLVATSNSMPDDLYKNGLQRKLFLPAIELLKQYTTVLHVPTLIDYRLRHLKKAGVFHTPDDAIADENMEKSFELLANNIAINDDPIFICDRFIPIKKQARELVWFDFDVICRVPRSQQDYLAIAKKYNTVFISHIPIISPEAKDTINLFIRLVDVFYDARIRLVFSAADTIKNIYRQGPLLSDYHRTCSRLLEMQSEDYFSKNLTVASNA